MFNKTIRRSKIRLIRIAHQRNYFPWVVLFGLMTATVLVSVSLAAAADFHPTGYDKNCNLCQFTKAPFIKTILLPVVLSSDCILWDILLCPVVSCQELILCMGGSRAPPSPVSSSV